MTALHLGSSSRGSRLPTGRLVAVLALLSLLPLGLLAYLTSSLAADAVEREVRGKLHSTAALSAVVVGQDLEGLAEVVTAYAERPAIVEALGGGDPAAYDSERIATHLQELRQSRPGIYTTFLARPDGILIDVVPETPAIVGDDFSFRDWYRGVMATGGPYVSEAYRTQAAGSPLVVGAAALVRAGDGSGRPLAILVAAYGVDYIQELAEDLAVAQGVKLKVTDQRGVLVASGTEQFDGLASVRDDPRVAAALAGRSGIDELETPDGRRLSAYAPVAAIGWTVTASVPADTAFAAVASLRSTVFTIAAALALVLAVGLALLTRTLRARRRAEDESDRFATINRAVLDATVDAIRMVDLSGQTVVSNAAMERMARDVLALGEEGSIWERTAGLADRTTDPAAYRADLAAIESDPERVALDDYQLATGPWIQRYTAPVRDADGGEIIGRIFVLRDVTVEREAERLKGELVATVSHELRTPLASILGFSELLVTRDLDEATRTRYLDTVHGEARRLTQLVNDFLDLQRIEAGGFSLNLEPFDVRSVLDEEATVFSGQSAAHVLEVVAPSEPAVVVGERERIIQVVANLLSNAIKYSPAGGTVTLSAEELDGAVRVSVTDTGLGIPAREQRHIFEKFFRVDSSDTREIGGTGLGLALSREIVHAHGGRIGFDSVEGEGSTFWFELPGRGARNGDGRPVVLVVEDDPVVASLLSEYLGAEGYAIEVAATGEEALERAFREPPVLVCLDLVLAGELDGWQVLSRLKDSPATAHVPVVICTARNGRARAASLGASDFLTKPFSPARLRETLERVMPDGGRSVLVVDDEPSVRRLVLESLSGNGFELREAAGGEEALREVELRSPDAIVLDLLMPEVDGFAVLERLQADPERRSIPVIVLTAKRLTQGERRALQERAVSLFEKSAYSAVELERAVLRVLAAREGEPVAS